MIARYVCLSWPVAEYLQSYFQISETFVYVTHSFVMAIYSSMVAHCQIVEIWRHLATSVACVLRFIIARHMFIYDNFNILLSKSCSCIATPWYYTRTWWFEAILYIHYNNNISQQIIVFTLYIAKCATMVSRISWCNTLYSVRHPKAAPLYRSQDTVFGHNTDRSNMKPRKIRRFMQ